MAIRSRGIGGRKRFSKRCSAVKFAAWVVGREFGGRGVWEVVLFFFLVNYIYGKSKTIEIVVLYLKENMSRFVNVNVNFRLGDSSWRGFFFDEIEIYQNK